MNTKKTKHKTHGKSPKTTQETKQPAEVIDDIEIKSENVNINDTGVQEKVSDSLTAVENEPMGSDIPKKPKRSKGKKKKELLVDDSKTKGETNETTKNDKEISDNSEKCMEDIVQITPCLRKKKKKARKQVENLNENIERSDLKEVKYSDSESLKPETGEKVPVDVQGKSENNENSTSKKKKKKKRHDSEASEKCDPCTLAFQKLIESPNETKTVRRDILEISEEKNEVPLMNVTTINPEEINIQEPSIKKKTANDKMYAPEAPISVQDIEISISNIQNISRDDVLTVVSLGIEDDKKETSPKPKAKIAKPVQKKHKNKSDSENDKSDNILDTSKTTETEELDKSNTFKKESSSNNDSKKESVVAPNNSKTNIHENSQFVDDPPDMNNALKSESFSKKSDNLGFVEVKTSKSKKKRNKNATASDSIETKLLKTEKDTNLQNVDDKNTENKIETKSEEVETHTVIIPDLIEYPRSTSQQNVDSNNNTFIQEITPIDEVQLGIPINMPTPIIQGSGESPEAKSICNDVIEINVTEIVTPNNTNTDDNILLQTEKGQSSEKTDIKSKMIEVNRDMEELRRSIERSLAELTATDKSDNELDKKFDELFQSQTTEPISTEITVPKNIVGEIPVKVCEKNPDDHKIEKEESKNKVDEMKHESKELDVNITPSDENKGLPFASDDSGKKQPTGEKQEAPPVCPARKDKGKTKSKKKGKQITVTASTSTSLIAATQSETSSGKSDKDAEQKAEQSQQKSETTEEKGKQQSVGSVTDSEISQNSDLFFEPIEKFEDALTSSVDDVNQTFEIIAKEASQQVDSTTSQNNPQINIISPTEESDGEEKYEDNSNTKKEQNVISRPKNLLGHPNIPASSNKSDFKKEKSKPPSAIQAKVKIKDSMEIEKTSNKTQTNKKSKLIKESNGFNSTFLTKVTSEDLIFKYSFRKVFLQSLCNVCNKELPNRIPCKFCSLVFYCSQKHKEEDWSHHQSLCFAVSTVAHLKEQKHVYADAQSVSGHEFRLLRMQAILSCEKILDRKLMPWEQEALLYPRICADVKCRQWKQEQLKDCAGCGQISYCINHPEHLPSSHQRWCKSYALYQKLVNYQLTKGRLQPPLPTKVLNSYQMPGKINDVLGSMYEEKIDMDDMQYAALTQIATAPLTAAYSYQIHANKMNSTCANGVRKNSNFTIHIVGAELPFEADALNKWEIFFLHLRSDVKDLRVVMVGPDINSSKLPLDLLGKIKLCENCQLNKRRVILDFYDNESYYDYYMRDDFVTPDIVCAFNPNIHRSSCYDVDKWPSTINSILKQRVPFVVTSYSIEELRRDVGKLRECAKIDFNVVLEIKYNPFGSLRPDRNFITDHEIPLLFKNYCFCILCGTL